MRRLFAHAVVAAVLAVAITGCVPQSHRPAPTQPPPPTRPRAVPPPSATSSAIGAGVDAGPPVSTLGLTTETAREALAAFRRSCPSLVRRTDASGLARPADWAPACADAATRLDLDGPAFFARWFETARVGGGNAYATGYYEPEIAGSRDQAPGYDVPIYRRPPDLVTVDTPAGGPGQPASKRRGRMEDGRLVPYYDRAAIDAGTLAGKGLELGWAHDPVELFFLQIQGSGRLLLPDGTVMRLGYDGQNGREYVGIGRLMRDRGLLGPNQLSMQGTMAWLRANPDEGRLLMEENKSYVFFKELTGPGPLGALGVQVVGHASVAADPRFVPLGAPVFLTLDRPEASGLWVAQDTGGAIKGANRFDTFWGAGAAARVTAGGMSARGDALILVPLGTVARLRADGWTTARP